jgi:two-component system cell cycle response regulator DivK
MSQRILVVEDNDRNRRLLKILLRSRGYEVIEAVTGEEAMKYLRDHKPGLILMDIQLPNVDGLELTKNIKSNPKTADIPIVAVTAYAMKGDRERILEAGCDGYISKPIDTRRLALLVAEILKNSGNE